jgi:hypothetical protein
MSGPKFLRYVMSCIGISIGAGWQFGLPIGIMVYCSLIMVDVIIEQIREDQNP